MASANPPYSPQKNIFLQRKKYLKYIFMTSVSSKNKGNVFLNCPASPQIYIDK